LLFKDILAILTSLYHNLPLIWANFFCPFGQNNVWKVKFLYGGVWMPRIKCGVDDCIYQEGSECKASSIQVKPTASDMMISISDDTACETFKPRNNKR
jgi:hypothetical protein